MNGLYYISSSGSRFPAAFSIAFKSSGSEFSSGGREVVALSPDGSVSSLQKKRKPLVS